MRDVAGEIYADLVGKPFRWRGRGTGGFDCFGLVLEMFRRTGRDMPEWDTPPELSAVAGAVEEEFARGRWAPCERGPGAMVLFNMPVRGADGRRRLAITHCGFMTSPNEFVHAWEQTGGITVERMHEWEHRIAGFYSFKASE